MPPLAILTTLGPLELIVILAAVATLFGIPVLLMAFVLWINRRWHEKRRGDRRPRPAPGEARGP